MVATELYQSNDLLSNSSELRKNESIAIPNLIQIQQKSFEWFRNEGLKELFEEISPIQDYAGGRFELNLLEHKFGEPKNDEKKCRIEELSYTAPLYIKVELLSQAPGPSQGERKIQELFIGEMPIMTQKGTFIINGAERVVVSQLVRSPGVYFTSNPDPNTGRELTSANLIPYRGAWIEFETSAKNIISVKIDRKRKSPATLILSCLGYSQAQILKLFKDVDKENSYLGPTMERDQYVGDEEKSLVEMYKRLRPGEPPSVENARTLINNLFFDNRRYDLGKVGRYKINRRLNINSSDPNQRVLSKDDIVTMLKKMIEINNGLDKSDDIDHLGNRRVRSVGELIQNQMRVGLIRLERGIREKMTTQLDPSSTTPAALVNTRPIVASIREFFGGSQLSQFMDQTNPLSELTHKRRLSALGPGGLSRERAGYDVRDVHHSHYGRICPIETPEGPNIGLLGSLATCARTNNYGFIETPYRKIKTTISNLSADLEQRMIAENVTDTNEKTIIKSGRSISKGLATRISKLSKRQLQVKPYVSFDPEDIVYLSADEEEKIHIAQANSRLNSKGEFIDERVETRKGESVSMEPIDNLQYMDVSPLQLVSVSTSLIPFLEHDDANRALMGSNMQRQAVPLVKPEAPLVSTGMENRVATDSGQAIFSETDGVVTNSNGELIEIHGNDGKTYSYELEKFYRSNQGTCINQRPIVKKGDVVSTGTIIADSSSTDRGQLALGQNLIVAFMSWEGYNYEDAIILNEKLVKDDRFTSIHIEKHEIEARDTKLGPEEITRDIPNLGEEALRDLDEEGIIRIGAEVEPGDVLVGKITPKGETELSAEEKLLRAIFGEKARDVKDSSLRVPHGQRGKIISVRVIEKSETKSIAPGVNKIVRVWVAQTRKISVGDKMAGRHGNKGVISVILPEEDMPFLPDGTPVDIILNPIGVSSRMNLGQILETHLGLAAGTLGIQAKAPVFSGQNLIAIEDMLARIWIINQANKNFGPLSIDLENYTHIEENLIKEWLESKTQDYDKVFGANYPGEAREACLRVWLKDEQGIDTTDLTVEEINSKVFLLNQQHNIAAPTLGKSVLYDGKTGEKFDQPISVGYIYMMKLSHLVEDKVHARSTGPYSLITQQPLGGKAQFGGQRFGEMEVWALEAYSAAHNLQEILTVKSDDVIGRVKTYEAIVKGESVSSPGLPESFRVLLKELQSLGLSIELIQNDTGELGISSLDDDLPMNDSDAITEISLVKDSSEMEVDRELQSLLENTEIADEAIEGELNQDESTDEAVETEPNQDESTGEAVETEPNQDESTDEAVETEPNQDESTDETTEK